MNVVWGYVGMIKEGLFGKISPLQGTALDKVLRRADDQLAMINSILYATSLETGAVKVRRRGIDLREFLQELRSHYDLPLDKNVTFIAVSSRFHQDRGAPSFIEFKVLDTGVGISPDHLRRIFDIFY